MTLHTYTPQPMSLPSMNFLHLTVSEIQPRQTIYGRKILNNIITKKNSVNLFPDKFYENGVEITNKIDIANGFNKFM